MAKPDQDFTVTQSLIDRLDSSKDPGATRANSVRLLKDGLRRDLIWLLNSRRNPEAAGDSLKEVSASLYNYGLPDFASLTINSPRDRSRLLVEIEKSLALFEPRLKNIRVSFAEDPTIGSRVLRFQIEGQLQMDPSPERVSFDTVLQLSSGEYQVRGDRGA